MAFTIKNLENFSGSGDSVRVFGYKTTTDNRAAVNGAGYFNGAANLMRAGDRIHIASSDVNYDAAVASVTAGVVTIAAVGAFV